MSLTASYFTLLIALSLIAITSSAQADKHNVVPGEARAEVSPTPIAMEFTAADKKKLLQDFKKANSDEEKTLDRQEKTAYKEIQTAQAIKLKEWRNDERKARRVYFDQHSSSERRAYVQDYIKRKEKFEQSLKDELAASRWSFKGKKDALKQSQKEREVKFKLALEHNVQPDQNLWPASHY